ncbi:hypothetical protein BDV98DRAFT_508337, partial [Pterulicium gracile]
VPFGVTYEKIGTIQRRLAWPLHKDDTLARSGRPTGLNIYFFSRSNFAWLNCVSRVDVDLVEAGGIVCSCNLHCELAFGTNTSSALALIQHPQNCYRT